MKASDETRRLQSLAKKNKPSPHKGKKQRPEVVEARAARRRGEKQTPYFIEFMSKLHKGNKYRVGHSPSQETREKLSVKGKGNKSRTGQKQSEEEKNNRRDAMAKSTKPLSNNKVGLRGVSVHQGRYRARARMDGKVVDIGIFDCPAAAHFHYLVTIDTLIRSRKKD